MKELFGQRLREQRIKHGLTLEQLAEKSELSSNYIGMVERGLKSAMTSVRSGFTTSASVPLNTILKSSQMAQLSPCWFVALPIYR